MTMSSKRNLIKLQYVILMSMSCLVTLSQSARVRVCSMSSASNLSPVMVPTCVLCPRRLLSRILSFCSQGQPLSGNLTAENIQCIFVNCRAQTQILKPNKFPSSSQTPSIGDLPNDSSTSSWLNRFTRPLPINLIQRPGSVSSMAGSQSSSLSNYPAELLWSNKNMSDSNQSALVEDFLLESPASDQLRPSLNNLIISRPFVNKHKRPFPPVRIRPMFTFG